MTLAPTDTPSTTTVRARGREQMRLLRLRPDLRVSMSGYTEDAVLRHGILADEVAFLQKPIMPQTLRAKLRWTRRHVWSSRSKRHRGRAVAAGAGGNAAARA